MYNTTHPRRLIILLTNLTVKLNQHSQISISSRKRVDVVPVQGGILGDGVGDKIRQAGWGHWISHGGVFVSFSFKALFVWEREMA
jgi:hypothetical protein